MVHVRLYQLNTLLVGGVLTKTLVDRCSLHPFLLRGEVPFGALGARRYAGLDPWGD